MNFQISSNKKDGKFINFNVFHKGDVFHMNTNLISFWNAQAGYRHVDTAQEYGIKEEVTYSAVLSIGFIFILFCLSFHVDFLS